MHRLAGKKKNERHHLQVSRLQTTIDNLNQKIQDKDDIIYGLRCRLAGFPSHPVAAASSAGHAAPVVFDIFDTATDVSDDHASPVLFDSSPLQTQTDQLQCSHLSLCVGCQTDQLHSGHLSGHTAGHASPAMQGPTLAIDLFDAQTDPIVAHASPALFDAA
eukprot:8386397-Karenia_brevis.AAC.1